MWSIHLSDIFLDLINDIPSKDRNQKHIELKSLVDDCSKHSQLQINTGQPPHITRDLFWRLYNFEIYLKEIFDKAGYQTKRKDSASDAIR